MLLEKINSTGVNHDDHHLQSSYFYSTGHEFVCVLDQYFLDKITIFL
jgi:hypothetical protein